MSQFGLVPFGTEGAFGGPGQFEILNVLPVAANEAIAFFNVEPKEGDPLAFDSVTNVRNWTLDAIDPSIPSTTVPGLIFVPKGEAVPTVFPGIVNVEIDDEDPTQVHLFTCAKLEHRVRYQVSVNPQIRGDSCETFAGPETWEFRGLKRGPMRRARFEQQDRYRDWDNTLFPKDASQPSSTWKLEPTGDIALHDEDASLKKRILRRIMSRPGDFPHLGREYGAGISVKALARTGAMQTLANSIAAQVRKEPDVLLAGVQARIRTEPALSGTVEVSIFVKRREQRDARFLFEFPTA